MVTMKGGGASHLIGREWGMETASSAEPHDPQDSVCKLRETEACRGAFSQGHPAG